MTNTIELTEKEKVLYDYLRDRWEKKGPFVVDTARIAKDLNWNFNYVYTYVSRLERYSIIEREKVSGHNAKRVKYVETGQHKQVARKERKTSHYTTYVAENRKRFLLNLLYDDWKASDGRLHFKRSYYAGKVDITDVTAGVYIKKLIEEGYITAEERLSVNKPLIITYVSHHEKEASEAPEQQDNTEEQSGAPKKQTPTKKQKEKLRLKRRSKEHEQFMKESLSEEEYKFYKKYGFTRKDFAYFKKIKEQSDVLTNYLPLSINQHKLIKKILEGKVHKWHIRKIMEYHCSTMKYLQNCLDCTHRYTIQGTKKEIIEEKHREYAKKVLDKKKKALIKKNKGKQ